MVERQPGRPSEEEFIGAASRFIADNYRTEPIHSSVGFFVNIHHVCNGKTADIDTIRRECMAEGVPGERESIHDFAVRQLATYQKQRKD